MSSNQIPIRRHSIASVECYEISIDELNALEREGGNVGLDFQMCLFCVTLAASFFVALLTTHIDSQRTYTVFVVLVIAGTLLGGYFFLRWRKTRGEFSRIVAGIRARQVGPVGDVEHPLMPSEAARLPVIKPTDTLHGLLNFTGSLQTDADPRNSEDANK